MGTRKRLPMSVWCAHRCSTRAGVSLTRARHLLSVCFDFLQGQEWRVPPCGKCAKERLTVVRGLPQDSLKHTTRSRLALGPGDPCSRPAADRERGTARRRGWCHRSTTQEERTKSGGTDMTRGMHHAATAGPVIHSE